MWMSTSLLGSVSRINWTLSPSWRALSPAALVPAFHTFRPVLSTSSTPDQGAESKTTADDEVVTKEAEPAEALAGVEENVNPERPSEKPMKRRARFIQWITTEGS